MTFAKACDEQEGLDRLWCLQQLIRELLIKNQQLRMALESANALIPDPFFRLPATVPAKTS